MDLKKLLKNNSLIFKLRQLQHFWNRCFPMPKELGYCAENASLEYPLIFEARGNVYIEENTKIRSGCHIINSPKEKVIIKKYSALAKNCTIITNNHKSRVSVPHILLGTSHVNDKSTDIIIEEDVWVGVNVTLLAGSHLGRGSIVGAGSIVSKNIPPYALVAGTPAKIIGVKFSIDDILNHERTLYPDNERFTREELEALFAEYYEGKKIFGDNKPLDDTDIEKINRAKKLMKYIEPL